MAPDWTPSRSELLSLLASAALDGGLGFFIGSGFSIALTADRARRAPTWGELLDELCDELDLTMPPIESSRGMSYPRIASDLVMELAIRLASEPAHRSLSFEQRHGAAVSQIKGRIARLCVFDPSAILQERYQRALESIRCAWVVTTNYDLLVELLLPDASVLLPSQVMPTTRRVTPVYHLHGHRLDPDSIVITERDYVRIIRFDEYRQLKLSLLLSESTTLLLGYGLGDINVLTALDWSRRYSGARPSDSERGLVVQALWCGATPPRAPYRGVHREVVLEVPDVLLFLEELAYTVEKLRGERQAVSARIAELSDDAARDRFKADSSIRQEYLRALEAHASLYGNRDVLLYLDAVLDPLWSNARADGGFHHYAVFLDIVIDALRVWKDSGSQPALFAYLTNRLADVASYIDPSGAHQGGLSWAATDLWQRRKGELALETLRELAEYGERAYRTNLQLLCAG